MVTVIKYTSDQRNIWNSFLNTEAKTNSFLFSRNFMEYHSDKFEDFSIIVYDDNKPVLLFPANITNTSVISHGGLTFGGFIVKKEEYTKNVLLYISSLFEFLHHTGIKKIVLKQSPSFYSSISQDDVDYAMFLSNAVLTRFDISYAINLQAQANYKIPYQERRVRAIKKAVKENIIIKEVNDFQPFWDTVLTPNLQLRFGVNPVHSLAEIENLALNNKGHIRQFEAWKDGQLLAGTTIFETPYVAHAQYISTLDEGRKCGAIDLLFAKLIQEVFISKNYFDFGIVNEDAGRRVNTGLLDWKEGFGARAYAHRFYETETCNYEKIKMAIG
jgi:hypothetical protein